jgi:hypothetical protein
MNEIDNDRVTSSESIAIYLHGDELDPGRVTETLQVNPTEFRKKGDTTLLSSGSVSRAKEGVWVLRIEADSANIGTSVDKLMAMLGDRGSAIPAISGIEDSYLDIFVAMSPGRARKGEYQFALSPSSVLALSRAGLSVQFTFYVTKS